MYIYIQIYLKMVLKKLIKSFQIFFKMRIKLRGNKSIIINLLLKKTQYEIKHN